MASQDKKSSYWPHHSFASRMSTPRTKVLRPWLMKWLWTSPRPVPTPVTSSVRWEVLLGLCVSLSCSVWNSSQQVGHHFQTPLKSKQTNEPWNVPVIWLHPGHPVQHARKIPGITEILRKDVSCVIEMDATVRIYGNSFPFATAYRMVKNMIKSMAHFLLMVLWMWPKHRSSSAKVLSLLTMHGWTLPRYDSHTCLFSMLLWITNLLPSD